MQTSTTAGPRIRSMKARTLLTAVGAVAAAVATTALGALLLMGNVTVRYVARTITTSLVPGYRAAALWQLPGGAVLPAATLAALFGGMAASRAG